MYDYQVDLQGQTDFPKAFNNIINNFKDFFKVEVAYLLTDSASRAFQLALNQIVDVDGPSVYPVAPNNQAFLNFSLTNTSGLIVNNNSFTLAIDGTVLDKNREGQIYPLPSLPTQFAKGKDVQIFISEHTLQSTLIALHNDRLFKISPVDGVSADAVSLLFDKFSTVFGNDKLAKIVL